MKKATLFLILQIFTISLFAQINTDRVLAIGRNALYFEDYVLSIQYFNQVIKSKPWLAEPYFYRAVAKINLDDFKGAEEDCTLSQSLFESEMFGHKKGAFTDAYMDRVGRFEMANKGTIFLDEIGDLELSCQVKLLRVLQDQTFEVLGDSRPRKVDIRVVSATNRDLRSMVADRTFREDLFYRINLITVHLPALREQWDILPSLT